MPRFKDQAICIRLIDWSETSQIVSLLTQQHGLISGLAKGSKRTSPSSVARYSGGIELLTFGQAVGAIKPTTELATLTEWDLQDPYRHLRENLRAQRLAMYAAELASALLGDHDPHPDSFEALAQLLEELAEPSQHELALLRYQWRLLSDTGYRPRLDQDARSGQPLVFPTPPDQDASDTQAYTFDPQAGGLTNHDPQNNHAAWRVRPATVDTLRKVAADEPLDIDPRTSQSIERANRLLCVYARAILDRQLNTMQHILEPDANAPG